MNQNPILKELEGRINADNITSISGVVNFIQVHADMIVPCERICLQMNAYHRAFDFDDKKANYMKGLYLYLARENLK